MIRSSTPKGLETIASARPFVYLRHESVDFDELAVKLVGLNQSFEQRSKGRFEGFVEMAALAGIRLFHGEFNQVICSRGMPQPDQFIISPVTATNCHSVFRGQSLQEGELNIVAPHDEVNHQTQSQGYDNILFAISRERLEREAARKLGWEIGDSVRGKAGLPAQKQHSASLNNALRGTMDALKLGDVALAEALLENVLDITLTIMSATDPRLDHQRRPSNPQQLVSRAEELFRDRREIPYSTADCCEKLQVSERTLRNAFQETLGISPMSFYKLIRLNAVRQELKRDPETIHAVARRWGFRHPGEFAIDYARLFGEKPSDTFHGPKGFEESIPQS